MAETACPGRCNHRHRQALAAYEEALAGYDPLDPHQTRPQPPQALPVPGSPWCGTCQAAIRRDLAELGTLASHLAAGADGHRSAPGGERVAGTPGQRSPSPAADLADELYSVLYGWECAWWSIRFGRDGPPDRRGYLADRLTDTIVWLIDHFDGIITCPDIAVPFGEEIRDWRRDLANRTKAGTRRHNKPLRCPGHGCGHMSLTWWEGDRYVRCGNPDCGQALLLADYEELERLAAQLPAAS